MIPVAACRAGDIAFRADCECLYAWRNDSGRRDDRSWDGDGPGCRSHDGGVGDVRAIGFEATGDLRLGSGFGAFVSYSYNDSTYRDDVRNAAGTLLAATKGKTVVDAPKHLLKGELTYDLAGFNARIGANYMSRRYFTYTNDQSIAGRVLVDATLGYKFDLGGRSLEIQANATNLFDKKYVSTIGTNGFGNSGDNQTLMVGAPQQFFVTLKAGF